MLAMTIFAVLYLVANILFLVWADRWIDNIKYEIEQEDWVSTAQTHEYGKEK